MKENKSKDIINSHFSYFVFYKACINKYATDIETPMKQRYIKCAKNNAKEKGLAEVPSSLH